uniref:Integrin beta n=1 Tax=Astatotilapia calliptera TaxID=8154 RepID=A0AAX7SFC1_ASTCA
MWSLGTWMLQAALCCVLLQTVLPSARGLNMCMSGSATSCEECLLIHPSCAWCAQEDFGRGRSLTSRCDFSQNLLKRGCDEHFIEYPTSSINVLQNIPLSSKGSGSTQYDVVQIMPQKISLSLRPGDQTWFSLQVRQVEDYPVDLYYLMDLSLSMKDDLDTIRNLGTKLAHEMGKLTSNFRLGFGSFVDKNMSPFSYMAPKYKLFPNCVPSFGFRHILSLTDKVDRFNEEVQKQMVSRNRDAPEGGFDAILQAAVCKEKIGWRKEALHLLVFATDDVPHLALDGRLGGLVHPHDGQCHLNDNNEYSASTKMDYPSLALLGEKLAENNIFLNFAVTKRLYVIYKNFTALIPGTTVEILDQDSKNVIQLIIAAYNVSNANLSSEQEVSLSVLVSFLSENITLFFKVSFNVSVEARSCPPRGTDRRFTIKPVGFKDRLEVAVDYECDCGCSRNAQNNSVICSSIGTYNCGTCQCEPGYLGARCECQEGETSNMFLSACRESEGKQICSGRGECSCNQCLCYESEFGKIYGSFCECDDFSCARHKGILCSGHGECHCGECKCHAGYIGDNCNCSTETSGCISDDGQMCSGRGSCVCGRCQCTEPGAFGETCEKCPTCPDACGTKRECIECRLFNSGRLADNETCQRQCKDHIIPVETLKCVRGPDALMVLVAVVGSILLVGLLLLAAWKLVITIHDRREFARFQSASNPLYKHPISTHFVETDFSMYSKSYNGGLH